MTESVSSSSSFWTSVPDTDDDQTIASILAQDENAEHGRTLGKRLSHLSSIPQNVFFIFHTIGLTYR
uniref:Uncharacterized protein n=1 Tax=Kalanchoe fedtschenkoi TaxID=63787 RepID=A0A7N0RGL4_KALFE